MILALYPQFADADAITQTRLIGAWFRRKRLEARLIALEVGKLFGASAGAAGDYDMVDESAALAALGIVPKHFDVRDNATTG